MPEILTILVALGWLGVAIQLFAYARLSSGRLRAGSVSYQGLNVTGAMAVGASSAASGAWPSTVANVIWVGIGVTAIIFLRRHLLERRLLAARRKALRIAENRFRRASRPAVVSPAGATVDATAAETLDAFPDRPATTTGTRGDSTRPGNPAPRRRRRRASLAP